MRFSSQAKWSALRFHELSELREPNRKIYSNITSNCSGEGTCFNKREHERHSNNHLESIVKMFKNQVSRFNVQGSMFKVEDVVESFHSYSIFIDSH